MAVPQLETCCCGCSLGTGTKIIGWISLICSILMVIMIGPRLADVYDIEDHLDMESEEAEEIRARLPALKADFVYTIVVHIFNCGLTFMLLLGVYQNKAKLVRSWVRASLTALVLHIALNVGKILFLDLTEGLFSILFSLIDLYFILVVYSFYREIQNVPNYSQMFPQEI